MHHKDKISPQKKNKTVYKWYCLEENCSLSYIEESRKCLENRVMENKSCTSAITAFPTTTLEATSSTSR